LLDPTSTEKLSEKEKKIIADAQRAGKSLRSSAPLAGDKNVTAPHDTGGIIEQNVDSKAVAAFGWPGDESDVSGDAANPGKRTNVGRGD
jgi:hypothetical protein